MNPTPVPTPTTPQSVLGAQSQATNNTNGNTSWNQQWNQLYNQAWNSGYNNGSMPSADPSFSSAINQGYNAGKSTYSQRNPGGSGASGGGNGGNPTININTPGQPTGPTGPSQAEIDKQNAIRGEIGSGFDSYIGGLNSQLGLLPEHYQNLNDQVSQLYGSNKQDVQTSADQQNAGLDANDKQVDLSQDTSLKKQASDYASALQAGQIYLGANGAGDSSAANMYNIASANSMNKDRGALMQQAAGLHNDISLKRAQVQSTLGNEFSKLDTWKSSQLTDLSQWLLDQKDKIGNAIGMAGQQKQMALASLDQSALGRMQQLDDQSTQFKQGLQTWALQHATALDQLKATLAAYGKPVPADFSSNTDINTLIPDLGGGSQLFHPGQANYGGGAAGFYGQQKDQYGNATS